MLCCDLSKDLENLQHIQQSHTKEKSNTSVIHSSTVHYFVYFQIPKDWLLFVIVILVMAIDLTIILIGTAIPASRLNATLVGDSQHPMRVDVRVLYLIISSMSLLSVTIGRGDYVQ